MTRINPNDPKWTAYVLGELDKAETEAVERLLASSEEARELVEDLKAATVALTEACDAAPAEVLTAVQRASIRRAADALSSWQVRLAWLRNRSAGPTPHLWFGMVPMRWALGVVSVAVIAIAIGVAVVMRAPQRATEVARVEAPATQPSPQLAAPQPAAPQPAATQQTARQESPAATSQPVPAVAGMTQGSATTTFGPVIRLTPAFPNFRTNGTVSGTVRDTSGAVMPGVTVTADRGDGSATMAITDASGRYTISTANGASEYRLTATLQGFRPASANVRLDPLSAPEQNFTLAVGAVSESVRVSAEAPAVDVQSARRSVTFQGEQIRDLPTARNTAGLLAVTPGVAAPAPPVAQPAQLAAGGGRGGGRVSGVAGDFAGGVAGGVVAGRPSDSFPPVPVRGTNESYARTEENAFVRASEQPLATFSIDVDTASFSNIRRFLTQGQMPPKDAVRIEELVNYFTYDYPEPSSGRPIASSMAVTAAPWNSRNRLVRIGVKAREIDRGRRPASNLVFLIDVSGSMNTPQKLPLLKSGLKLMVDQLGENDTVSIVVYASATGMVLPPTRGDRKDVIARALDDLQAGGSTNGGAGIQLAYAQAMANFIRGGVNRVILMTDGDFNVGITSQADLTRLIEDRAKSGVFLSVLGFGMGNLKDSTMEKLADMGNGHYAYIDTLSEARKVLVEEMSGTLVTVAKDVKIQVDFNPAKVEAYRLIGYENRILRPEDFNNDQKDAGDMGAGHTVTALFEIVPRGGTVPGPSIDPSVFQPQTATRTAPPATSNSNDLLVLRLRYKLPDAAESTRMDVPLADRDVPFARADADVRFATAVAAFGMILKDSPYKGDATLEWVLDTASGSVGRDRGGYRDEFVSLVRKAIALSDRSRFLR